MPYQRRRAKPPVKSAGKDVAARAEPPKKKTEKVIEYKSADRTVSTGTYLSDTLDENGIVCRWSGSNFRNGSLHTLIFTWDFDWTKLQNQGVKNLTGHLILKSSPSYPNGFPTQTFDIDWEEGVETIDISVKSSQNVSVHFEYHLTYHSETDEITTDDEYDEMFAASETNDTVLVVEGKKLHVNKVFLSYHSEFFRALFFSDFKDGKLAEIPIKDVSYEDFGLLMSTIYPKTVFAHDRTVETLLELADRFLMPSVIANVEYHLLNNSKISNQKMMWMADAYGMPSLLKKTILLLDTVEKAKALQKSPEYEKLSKDAKSSVLDRLMQLI